MRGAQIEMRKWIKLCRGLLSFSPLWGYINYPRGSECQDNQFHAASIGSGNHLSWLFSFGWVSLMSGGGAKKAAPDTVIYRTEVLHFRSRLKAWKLGDRAENNARDEWKINVSHAECFFRWDARRHLLDAPPRQLHAEKSCKKRQVRAVITALDNKHRGEKANQTDTDCYIYLKYI